MFIQQDLKGKSILIAYHAHCIDGFTAAWACNEGLFNQYKVPQEAIHLLPVEYDKINAFEKEVIKHDAVYIVDFSVPLATLAKLQEWNIMTTVLDHHKTAQDMYINASEMEGNNLYGTDIHFDMTESGATLTWKYFFGHTHAVMPKFLAYVADYDLWKFELKDTRYINRFLRIQEQTLEHWSYLIHDFSFGCSLSDAVAQGKAIDSYHKSIVASLCEGAEEVELAGQVGLTVNCSPQFSSDVGHELALKSGTFGATWQQVKGDVKISLRSNGDYDVSTIAKQFGGGGHKNAAGFTLTAPQEGTLFPDEAGKMGVKLWVA